MMRISRMAILVVIGTWGPGTCADQCPEAAQTAAVAFTGFPSNDTRVEFIPQRQWPDWCVYRIETGSCFSLRTKTVAVSSRMETLLLTGDLELDVKGKWRERVVAETGLHYWEIHHAKYTYSAEQALRNFALISEKSGVQLQSPDEAQAYLEFFLSVFISDVGVYLPLKRQADLVTRLPAFSDESKLARRSFSEKPVVRLTAFSPLGAAATTYVWKWWYGGIDRYNLTVSANGAVTFDSENYADQKYSRER